MRTIERLRLWREAGTITGEQHEQLSALVLKQRFSLFLELNALLYLGVLSLVAGVAWIVQTYFASLGDAFILTALSGLFASCVVYCFSKAPPYSPDEVESPNLVFDYILYAACLILMVELGYIETRFNLLGTAWDHYLLVSAVLFLAAAYRFDNRLVLSLALSSLAGWFGLRFSRLGLLTADSLRVSALVYGGLVLAAGMGLNRRHIKKHFFETYLHVAANVVLAALVSGLGNDPSAWLYLAALVVACGIATYFGIRFRRFAFVAYAIVYGYAGVSYQLFHNESDTARILTYVVVTGSMVVLGTILLARRFGREE